MYKGAYTYIRRKDIGVSQVFWDSLLYVIWAMGMADISNLFDNNDYTVGTETFWNNQDDIED